MVKTILLFPRSSCRRLLTALGLLLCLCWVNGCSTGDVGGAARSSSSGGGAVSDQTAAPGGSSSRSATAAAPRPGLGTEFGEERRSDSHGVAFVRANGDQPLATAAIYYDDRAGVRAQAGRPEETRGFAEPPPQARGLIDLNVVGENNFAIRTFTAGGRRYVIGTPGDRYAIAVRNRTDARLEVVLSVDGLDVLDGRSASYAKPGYVIPP
ncbi:MAG: hypothetical protein JO117_10095, partial [Verrucomicrobia bacterium]|nr:hypothetical protein [Verrucomicrobiota bacterium]